MKTTSSTSATKTKGGASVRSTSQVSQPDMPRADDVCPREQMIAEAAYYRAERRGFAAGNEMSDWLQAEADVEAMLATRH